MPSERAKELGQILKKIPIFKGLSPSQVQAVLKICKPQSYQATEVVCASSTPSDEMYILLSGQLGVITADEVQVATLDPVTTVGEMGLMTKKDRVASVRASQPSSVLVLPRAAFEYLMRRDADIQARIYRNVIDVLSDKIVNDNVRLRDHVQETVREEKRIREYRRRAEAAERLLVQETEMSRPSDAWWPTPCRTTKSSRRGMARKLSEASASNSLISSSQTSRCRRWMGTTC